MVENHKFNSPRIKQKIKDCYYKKSKRVIAKIFAALFFIYFFAYITFTRLNTIYFPQNQNIVLFSYRNAKIRKFENELTSLFSNEYDKFIHQINRLDELF